MARTTKKQMYFDVVTILAKLKDPFFINIVSVSLLDGSLLAGDLLLVDRMNKKPKIGDLVCWGDLDHMTYGRFTADSDRDDIFGVASALIRQFTKPTKRRRKETRQTRDTGETDSLRAKLERLERLPENEATRFQLESEIYRIENQPTDTDGFNVRLYSAWVVNRRGHHKVRMRIERCADGRYILKLVVTIIKKRSGLLCSTRN